MLRASRAAGFTLIELMVALAVSAFVIAGVLLAFYAQTSAYATEHRQMFAQAGGRDALDYLEHTVRAAGFGVDPSRAILAYDGFHAGESAQTTPELGYPDAIVVHARDLDYQRTLRTVAANTLTFTGDAGTLPAGQILLLLCSAAEETAYVTVLDQTAADTVDLQPASSVTDDSPTGWPGPQFHEESKLTDACFQRPGVVAVKVTRSAFYVQAFADDPARPTVLTPYLMLHSGVDRDGSGQVDANDAVPLAAGVEQLQAAYIMDAIPGTCATPAVHGVTDSPPWGTAWRTATGPTLDTPYGDPLRCTNDVANVRQVRLTLVARGAHPSGVTGDDAFAPDAGVGTLTSGTVVWKPLENLTSPVAPFDPEGGGNLRVVLRTSVATPNLAMRSQFLPLSFGG